MYNNTCHCEERKRRSNLIICLITFSLFVTLNLFQGLVAPGFTRLAPASDYTFTTIDYPGAYYTWANEINNTGVLVGTFIYRLDPYQNYGFVREVDGSYRKIVFPGSVQMSALGINDAGQVVGMYTTGGTEQGYLLSDGVFTTIAFPDAITIVPMSISNTGKIVGHYWGRHGRHGFLLDGGISTTIDFPGTVWTKAYGSNDADQIVGAYLDWNFDAHNYLLSDGVFTTIAFPGAFATGLSDINNAGKIVGNYRDIHGVHGFLLDGGMFTTIDFPGATFTWVNGINDAGQIVGQYGDGTRGHGFLADPIKLLVTIPGINDSGLTMLTRAANMVNDDLECTVSISEVNGLSKADVRQVVTDITKKAKEKGKDVIVNIDMDLENYTWELILPPCPFEICIPTVCNPWHCSARWAGKMANIVSDAFTKEVPGGMRILYAHSAGGDATYQAVLRGPRKKPLYDNINIFNGRTTASALKAALARGGYNWWQVKVFTNIGDCPARPKGIAYYNKAKEHAGKAWVHLHSSDRSICPNPIGFCICHSVLRDNINIPVSFEVNAGSSGSWAKVATVEDTMM